MAVRVPPGFSLDSFINIQKERRFTEAIDMIGLGLLLINALDAVVLIYDNSTSTKVGFSPTSVKT